MKSRIALLALLFVVVIGCQPGPTTTPPVGSSTPPGPSPTGVAGVEGLVADLKLAGIEAKAGSSFAGEPIGGQGVAVCAGKESVQVYEFIDHDAALAASARIDRQDPSHVGNAIVEWVGTPRFWLRDRMLVLYLGIDAATLAALRAVLGPPFAQGAAGGPPPLRGPDCD